MTALVPPEFLFRYTFPVQRIDRLPRRGKRLLNLPEECVLPSLADLSEQPRVGELRLAWNAEGLALSVTVTGKSGPPVCDSERLGQTDGLRLWIDTRNTQSVHRAGRFCHQFEFLPAGGGDDGAVPVANSHLIARAKEEAPLIDSDLLPIQSEITKTGYRLEAWLPAAALHGYDPASQPRLGFYYALNDQELGLQTLSVGPEFPFPSDPSLWSTLELIDAG